MKLPKTAHGICKLGVLIAGLGASACWAGGKYEEFLSLHLGSTSATQLDAQAGSSIDALDMSSGQSMSLGYGLQENYWRILLQLNQTTADVKVAGTDDGAGTLTSTAIMYNVYWVPEIDYGISAIVGAGVGYANQDIKNVTVAANKAESISSGGWSAKMALGVEYRACKEASIQLVFENWLTDAVQDDKVPGWSVKDVGHQEISIGALYRF